MIIIYFTLKSRREQDGKINYPSIYISETKKKDNILAKYGFGNIEKNKISLYTISN